MKITTQKTIATIILLLVAVGPVFGLWGRFENDKPIDSEDWPKPIVKAINTHKRVYGAGSGEMGCTFYFVGTTEDFNLFLQQVAQDKETPLEILLIPEAGIDKPDPFETNLKINYNWSLHIDVNRYQLYKLLLDRKASETDAQFQLRQQQELAKQPKCTATIMVHCTGPIDPAALKIPLQYKASIGGRLARLADYHNQRRIGLKLDDQHATDSAPTTESDLEKSGRSLFIDTTQPANDNPSKPSSSVVPPNR